MVGEKKKLLFIINPISGVGKKNIIPKLLEKKIDKTQFDYRIEYTKQRGHGSDIAREQHPYFEAIIAVGGDGSVNEIGKELVNKNCALGIIPCGSGNGLARHAKIPLKIEKSIERINDFTITKIDTGKVNDKIFLGTCGFGFDAYIAWKFDQYHSRGFSSYIRLVLKEFKNYQPKNFEIVCGENKLIKSAFLLSIANSAEFGNGFKISPLSNFSDGKFELVSLEKTSYLKSIFLARKFFNGSIHHSKKFSSFSFEHAMEIRTTDNLNVPFHVDGEPCGTSDSFTIEVNKSSLNLI